MAYSNFDDDGEAAPPSEKQQMDGEGDGMHDDGSTSLLPKSFFGGKDLEPGKECKVQIVAVHGDDVEVKYVPHEEGEENESGMDGARNRMSMAADGGKMMAANSGGGGGGGGAGY